VALETMPYMQKVVSDYLRANLGGVRVVSDPPGEGNRDTPWVQVIQLPAEGNDTDPADRLVEFYFQFSCYAGKDGGKPEAERLARAVVDKLRVGFAGTHDAPTDDDLPVAVSCARRYNGPFSLPDTDAFEPARDRYIVEHVLYAHTVNR